MQRVREQEIAPSAVAVAPPKSLLRNILRASPCVSIFCLRPEVSLEANPKGINVLRGFVRKNCLGISPGRIPGNQNLLLVVRTEVQAGRVHAVPQSGRRRTVFKHVPQMSVALGAANLGPDHAVGRIFMLDDIAGLAGLRKTWPAGPGIE